jgi:hypothetical protein
VFVNYSFSDGKGWLLIQPSLSGAEYQKTPASRPLVFALPVSGYEKLLKRSPPTA